MINLRKLLRWKMIDQNKGKEKKKWYDILVDVYQKKQSKVKEKKKRINSSPPLHLRHG